MYLMIACAWKAKRPGCRRFAICDLASVVPSYVNVVEDWRTGTSLQYVRGKLVTSTDSVMAIARDARVAIPQYDNCT